MGVEMMAVMTAQPPLPVTPSGAIPFGAVAALVQDNDGGRVFIRGELCFVWDGGDEAGRRLTAVQLVRIKAAIPFGAVAALVQDNDGGRVFIRGELCFVWDGGDEAGRRLTAVQL